MAASTWNNAGTWEEKDCTVWAKEALSSGLKAAATTSDPKAEVTEVHQVEGHAHLLHVRGTARVGMEWTIKLMFKVTGMNGSLNETSSGSILIQEMTETDIDDFEIELSGMKGGKAEMAATKKAGLLLREPIAAVVKKMMADAISRAAS